MASCGDRQRIRRLLAEAVTMLCKSSLKYKLGFSVEGLIGITLDDNQVILVNINEERRTRKGNEMAFCKTNQGDDPIDLRIGLNIHGSSEVSKTHDFSVKATQSFIPSTHSDHCMNFEESPPSIRPTENGVKRRKNITNELPVKIQKDRTNEFPVKIKEEDKEMMINLVPRISPCLDLKSDLAKEDYAEHDVIFIKDEEIESDNSDLEMMHSDDENSREDPIPPLLALPHPVQTTVNTSVLNLHTSDLARDPPKSSPVAVTYEAGLWATEDRGTGGKLPHSNETFPDGTLNASKTAAHASDTTETNLNPSSVQLEAEHPDPWPAGPERRPRASYSTAYKLMVVRKAMESGNMRATARKFGIHFKQVWQWTRNKEKLLAMSLSALRSPRLYAQTENATTETSGNREKTKTNVSKALVLKETAPKELSLKVTPVKESFPG